MKMTRVRNNMVVRNKVNSQKYVLAVTKTPSGIGEVNAFPLGEDGEIDEEAPGIVITEENAICFRILKDPDPKDIPLMEDFSIEDGIIYFCENRLVKEQGEIQAVAILATTRSNVIFTAKAGEDTIRIMSYDLDRDIFRKIVSPLPATTKFNATTNGDNLAVIDAKNVVIEEVKGEDGKPETVMKCDVSSIYTIYKGSLAEITKLDSVFKNIEVKTDDKGNILAFADAVGDIGCDNIVSPDDSKETILVIFDKQGCRIAYRRFDYSLKYVTNSYTETTGFSRIFIGDNIIQIEGVDDEFKTNVKELTDAGFIYVVDYSRKNGSSVVTLANASATQVKTISKTYTEDRGTIYAVA